MNEAFTQLFAIGPLWIAIHCVGMCGPILTGVDVTGVASGAGLGRGVARLAAFQTGKALVYIMLGSVAGLVGQQWLGPTETLSAYVTLAIGVLVGCYALQERSKTHAGREPLIQLSYPAYSKYGMALRRVTAQVGKFSVELAKSDSLHHSVALGMAMAFLPCMLPVWVLGLAAVSGSPWVGMGLMLAFSGMTGLALLGITILPSVAAKRLVDRGILIIPNLLLISAAWFVMVGLAGLDIIEHLHIRIGGGFVMMFW